MVQIPFILYFYICSFRVAMANLCQLIALLLVLTSFIEQWICLCSKVKTLLLGFYLVFFLLYFCLFYWLWYLLIINEELCKNWSPKPYFGLYLVILDFSSFISRCSCYWTKILKFCKNIWCLNSFYLTKYSSYIGGYGIH